MGQRSRVDGSWRVDWCLAVVGFVFGFGTGIGLSWDMRGGKSRCSIPIAVWDAVVNMVKLYTWIFRVYTS